MRFKMSKEEFKEIIEEQVANPNSVLNSLMLNTTFRYKRKYRNRRDFISARMEIGFRIFETDPERFGVDFYDYHPRMKLSSDTINIDRAEEITPRYFYQDRLSIYDSKLVFMMARAEVDNFNYEFTLQYKEIAYAEFDMESGISLTHRDLQDFYKLYKDILSNSNSYLFDSKIKNSVEQQIIQSPKSFFAEYGEDNFNNFVKKAENTVESTAIMKILELILSLHPAEVDLTKAKDEIKDIIENILD